MKYIRCYAIEWDEMYQIGVADDDPVLQAAVGHPTVEVSSSPFTIRQGTRPLPIRPRSREAADKERALEYEMADHAAVGVTFS